MRKRLLAGALLALCCAGYGAARVPDEHSRGVETWRFERTDSIAGYPAKVLGHPQVIHTPYGRAMAFNGVDDAMFIPVHPLAGAESWTWEVIFRPDGDGASQQRFFHLSVLDAAGNDTDNRMLLETRIVEGQWCLDSFAVSQGISKLLLDCHKLHPLDKWYRVTAVYDGRMFRNYVGSQLQAEAEVQLAPQGTGHSSVGVRINLKDHFKGAIFEARFTRRALEPREFLKMPEGMAGK